MRNTSSATVLALLDRSMNIHRLLMMSFRHALVCGMQFVLFLLISLLFKIESEISCLFFELFFLFESLCNYS